MKEIKVNNNTELEETVSSILKSFIDGFNNTIEKHMDKKYIKKHMDKKYINIGLPGGRSVIPVINSLMNLSKEQLSKLNFFLVDERLKQDYNAEHIMNNGFQKLLDSFKIMPEQILFPNLIGNIHEDFENYMHIMTENKLDLVFLGVGEDCHVASIFPNSKELKIKDLTSFVVNSPKPPSERITITLSGLKSSKKVLLILGDKKQALIDFKNNENNLNYPASFFKENNSILITNIL